MFTKKKNKGMCWHVHHLELIEYCYNRKERVAFIKKFKMEYERTDRLCLMQFVKGKLPEAVIVAAKVLAKADRRYNKWPDWDWLDLWKKRFHAQSNLNKVMLEYKEEIDKLHDEECPNCIWDGKQMEFNYCVRKESKWQV